MKNQGDLPGPAPAPLRQSKPNASQTQAGIPGEAPAQLTAGEARDIFQRRLTSLVAGAIKQAAKAHGDIDPGSVGKRVAAELWALTSPAAHPPDRGGDYITYVRGQLGWTQARLGEELGTNQANVARWESGRVQPRKQVLERVQELARLATAAALG